MFESCAAADFAFARFRRKPTFSISSVDYKTSHRTVVLPGFVNTRAFVPNIAVPNSSDVATATEAALAGGFTTVQIMPIGEIGRAHV